MTDSVDVDAAHRRFAAECFNLSWDLLDKAERSAAEDVTLIALAHSSLWHWMQRADCTDKSLSVAHWLLARVYCVTRRPEEASRYAALSLDFARRRDVPPFALAYAHEACARAAALQGHAPALRKHLREANAMADSLAPDVRERLLEDLATIAVDASEG